MQILLYSTKDLQNRRNCPLKLAHLNKTCLYFFEWFLPLAEDKVWVGLSFVTQKSKPEAMKMLTTEGILDAVLSTSPGRQSVREDGGNDKSENKSKTISALENGTSVHPTTPKPKPKAKTMTTSKPQQTTAQPPKKNDATTSSPDNGTKTGLLANKSANKKSSHSITHPSPSKTTNKNVSHSSTTPSPTKLPHKMNTTSLPNMGHPTTTPRRNGSNNSLISKPKTDGIMGRALKLQATTPKPHPKNVSTTAPKPTGKSKTLTTSRPNRITTQTPYKLRTTSSPDKNGTPSLSKSTHKLNTTGKPNFTHPTSTPIGYGSRISLKSKPEGIMGRTLVVQHSTEKSHLKNLPTTTPRPTAKSKVLSTSKPSQTTAQVPYKSGTTNSPAKNGTMMPFKTTHRTNTTPRSNITHLTTTRRGNGSYKKSKTAEITGRSFPLKPTTEKPHPNNVTIKHQTNQRKSGDDSSNVVHTVTEQPSDSFFSSVPVVAIIEIPYLILTSMMG
ncbi:unnamed protein product [Orchesella dallaii]|uniref:Uncharacterized protein n=1 Tax=Orchesella dallaii TaxID=48710 RepID=A0ABP1R635_9HEXA